MKSLKNLYTLQLEKFLQQCLCDGIARAKVLGADAFKGEQLSRMDVTGMLNQQWYKGCIDVPHVCLSAIRYDKEHYQYEAIISLDYLDHGWLIEQLNIMHLVLTFHDSYDGTHYTAGVTSKPRRYDNGIRTVYQSKSANWEMRSLEDFDLSTMIASL